MYRVLLPVDDNVDRARAQAEFAATLPGADDEVEAILLFVFHGDANEMPEELQRFNNAGRVQSVRRAREVLEEAGVETVVREDTGDTTQDILDDAEENDVDTIVLGGRKRSPAGKALFGSVTQSVILNTDRPVVVTGKKQS